MRPVTNWNRDGRDFSFSAGLTGAGTTGAAGANKSSCARTGAGETAGVSLINDGKCGVSADGFGVKASKGALCRGSDAVPNNSPGDGMAGKIVLPAFGMKEGASFKAEAAAGC